MQRRELHRYAVGGEDIGRVATRRAKRNDCVGVGLEIGPRIIGGAGWLYGGLAGAIVFKILQDTLSSNAPQFWMFWMGLFLVVLALVGRERLNHGVSGGMRALLARVVRR